MSPSHAFRFVGNMTGRCLDTPQIATASQNGIGLMQLLPLIELMHPERTLGAAPVFIYRPGFGAIQHVLRRMAHRKITVFSVTITYF